MLLPREKKILERVKDSHSTAVVWQKALNYRKPAIRQTTQLPRPVGALGFSIVDQNNFIVNGVRRKNYKVNYNQGIWTCDCEAYRYGNGKNCKHQKAIIGYFKNKQKIDAAEHQRSIF